MLVPHLPLATFGNLFGVDGLIILAVGLLIFGRRLPEVGKNLGKTIVEFKKGLSGTSEDKTQPEEEEAPAPARRLASSSSRVSAAPARPTRRLTETEEV